MYERRRLLSEIRDLRLKNCGEQLEMTGKILCKVKSDAILFKSTILAMNCVFVQRCRRSLQVLWKVCAKSSTALNMKTTTWAQTDDSWLLCQKQRKRQEGDRKKQHWRWNVAESIAKRKSVVFIWLRVCEFTKKKVQNQRKNEGSLEAVTSSRLIRSRSYSRTVTQRRVITLFNQQTSQQQKSNQVADQQNLHPRTSW